jgi:hypothetical protein
MTRRKQQTKGVDYLQYKAKSKRKRAIGCGFNIRNVLSKGFTAVARGPPKEIKLNETEKKKIDDMVLNKLGSRAINETLGKIPVIGDMASSWAKTLLPSGGRIGKYARRGRHSH